MNRAQLSRSARGLGALLGLLALVAGLPIVLAVVVGWPLPHGLPSLAAIRDALAQGWSPGYQVVIKVLAVVCWLAWAEVATCAVVEAVTALQGRSAPSVPMAGPLQLLVAKLVAAALIAISSVGSPIASTRPASLAAVVAGYRLERPRLDLVSARTEASESPLPSEPLAAPGKPTVKEIVVRPRDDLWDLAGLHLGDPFRWREIWELNAGRRQPDGRRFVEPQLIRPGWVLELPPDAVGVEAGPAATSSAPPSVAPGTAGGPMLPSGGSAPAGAGSTSSQPAEVLSPGGSAGGSQLPRSTQSSPGPRRPARAGPGSVVLPSGSAVWISLAAGIVAAVATARLRIRRRYQPSAPQPGKGMAAPDLGPTTHQMLTALRKQRAGDGDDANPAMPDEAPFMFAGLDDPRPGAVVIGERAGDPVELDISGLAGLALDGPGAPDVARCLVVALLTKGGPQVVQVLIPNATAGRILPGVACFPGLSVAEDGEDGLWEAEVQLVRRARLLDEEGVPDFATHRLKFPDDPLPAFILIADDLPEGRMGAVASLGARLGIGVVSVGPPSRGTSQVHLTVGAEGEVVDGVSGGLDAEATGAALHRLNISEAVELLGVLAAARSDTVRPLPADEAEVSNELAIESEGLGNPSAGTAILVRLLGPCRIEVAGEEIKTRLRGSARDLLAYFLVHPQGASAEAVADALWPEADPARGRERFWTALGNLRSRLREATGGTEKLIERQGNLYRVDAGVFNVDVWRCQAAFAEARAGPDDESVKSALVRAAAEYGGDLLEGSFCEWVEPVRQSLRRQVLDALARLSELQAREGKRDQALAALEQAIKIDPYAEELYRRGMRLLAQLGRGDAARRLLRQLEGRLSELDAELESETLQLAEAMGL